MNQSNASMTVIGAGSYGTALAITPQETATRLSCGATIPNISQRSSTIAATLRSFLILPFPDTLRTEGDLATALAASRNILVVVPSHVFGEVLRQIKPLMRSDARLVLGDKRHGSGNGTPVTGCRA